MVGWWLRYDPFTWPAYQDQNPHMVDSDDDPDDGFHLTFVAAPDPGEPEHSLEYGGGFRFNLRLCEGSGPCPITCP